MVLRPPENEEPASYSDGVVALVSACGAPHGNEAKVQATSASGQLLGAEVAVISIAELTRFVAGEDISIFKDFLTESQKTSARRELGKIHNLAPTRRAEAFASETGKTLIARTRQLVAERNSAVNVPNAQ
jgi:hypothetical protein